MRGWLKTLRLSCYYAKHHWWPLVRTTACEHARGGHTWGPEGTYVELYGREVGCLADQVWHKCQRCGLGSAVRR